MTEPHCPTSDESEEAVTALLDVELHPLTDRQLDDLMEELTARLEVALKGELPDGVRFLSDDLIRHFLAAAATITEGRDEPLVVPVEVEELLARLVAEAGFPEEPADVLTVTWEEYDRLISASLPSPLNGVYAAVPRVVPGPAVARSEDQVLLLPRSHAAG